MIKVLHLFPRVVVFVLFYSRDWQGGVFKIMKNEHFLNIFISFGLFLHMFGHVKGWLMLKLYKIK